MPLRATVIAFLVLIGAGCATDGGFPRSARFADTETGALIAVSALADVASPRSAVLAYRVDLEAEYVVRRERIDMQSIDRIGEAGSETALFVERVLPGDYVLLPRNTVCGRAEVPVFGVTAGAINFIPAAKEGLDFRALTVDELAQVERDAATALAFYPGITAPFVTKTPTALVRLNPEGPRTGRCIDPNGRIEVIELYE